MEVTWLKSASLTRSIVGLICTGGCSSRLLFATPVEIRNLDGKSQFLCARGAPWASRHCTFCFERFDRPAT